MAIRKRKEKKLWACITCTYDNGTFTLYVDGKQEVSWKPDCDKWTLQKWQSFDLTTITGSHAIKPVEPEPKEYAVPVENAKEDHVQKDSEGNALLALIDTIGREQKAKLLKKKAEGWHGWADVEYEETIARKLFEHATKAKTKEDWVDVANFAAFLWNLAPESVENAKGDEPIEPNAFDLDGNLIKTDIAATNEPIVSPLGSDCDAGAMMGDTPGFKPCPHCGTALQFESDPEGERYWHPMHEWCHLRETYIWDYEFKSWNRRAADDEIDTLMAENERQRGMFNTERDALERTIHDLKAENEQLKKLAQNMAEASVDWERSERRYLADLKTAHEQIAQYEKHMARPGLKAFYACWRSAAKKGLEKVQAAPEEPTEDKCPK